MRMHETLPKTAKSKGRQRMLSNLRLLFPRIAAIFKYDVKRVILLDCRMK